MNRSPESGAVTRSALVLNCRPGRCRGPGRLTPKVGAGDHPGEDAQTAPQRLLLLGGVRRRPLVSRWVLSVGPSHSAPRRGSRRQPCGRRSRRVSASSLQCERRDGRSEPPMRGCMYVPRPYSVSRRSVDGLSANLFTALRSAATRRIAALPRECEQMKLEIRPLIALRTNAGRYRPFPRGSAPGCGGL